jgi:cobalt-zinc-cadmium efflux system outer membrane protein
MKSLCYARRPRHLSVLLFACTALGAHTAHAGALTEAEAERRALALPAAGALDAAQQAEADANVQTVRRFDNPELMVSRERVSGTIGVETEWQVGATQSVGLNGARGSSRRALEQEAQAVGADIGRRRELRLAEVRIAYAACRAASERLLVLDDHAVQLGRIERAIGLRAAVGDAALYDLRRVRLEVQSVEAKRALAEGEIRASCAQLSALTGEPDARASEPLRLVAPTLTVGDGSRADLDARRYRIDSATSSADAARQRQLPDLTVGVGYKRIDDGVGSAGGPALSLGVRVPLFGNGGAERRAAEARRSALEADLTLAQTRVSAERDAAFARAEAAFNAATIAVRGAEDARRVATTAEAAYEGGETQITDLVDGYRASSEARIEAIDHSERAAVARAQLQLAQGGTMP